MPPIDTRPNDMANEAGEREQYWMSLRHREGLLAGDAPNSDALNPGDELNGTARRQFLKLMAASLGLAGITMTGCRRWPQQQVIPHNAQPEGTAPGRRQAYASCWELGGATTGVMVTSVDGRPIKIEGNPQHPYSLGAADHWAQAAILEMYDPERSRQVTENVPSSVSGRELAPRDWKQFLKFSQPLFDELRKNDGRGLAVLAGLSSSPTTLRLAQEWRLRFPQSQWYTYEPIHRDNEQQGIHALLGEPARPIWDFTRAQVVACFDADLFGTHPGRQRWTRQWSSQRTGDDGPLTRWYVAEPCPTITGSVADSRLPISPSRIPLLLETLGSWLGIVPSGAPETRQELAAKEAHWLKSLHTDLLSHPGSSLVVAGPDLPPRFHGLTVAINQALGNIGTSLTLVTEAGAGQGGCADDINRLSRAMERGEIQTLLILGGNPVFDAPAESPLALAPEKSLTSIHLSLYFNETSAQCRWHVPMAHWLESWGDGRAWDGTYSVRQPLILPLFDGKSDAELLAILLRHSPMDARELVRETCRQEHLLPASEEQFEQAWETLLHNGSLENSAFGAVKMPQQLKLESLLDRAGDSHIELATESHSGHFELAFRPDSSVYDGRFANNGWLQELPDPMTKLTWDNAAWMSPADAASLELNNGDIVHLTLEQDESIHCEIPVYIMPGQALNTLGLSFGYGRWVAGEIGNQIGTNVSPLRRQDVPGAVARGRISRTGRFHPFAMTQDHHLIDSVGAWGREERVGKLHQSGSIVREATWESYAANQDIFETVAHGPKELQLFDAPSSYSQPHAWGMSIDLTKCVGCSACVIACQAENNIPIVGKDQVARNREMHWIRIDRYFKGSDEEPEFVHMPMTCHHCETAPCEQVCPVAATVHDSEGLNAMVYNRCIGTRYCSNNCPAKVRHFNFFDYHATSPSEVRKPWLAIPDLQQRTDIDPLRQMQFNPEVTVRMRGVMEKCTFCTQRIQAAKIAARVAHAQGRRDTPLVLEGEVIPACAAACPAEAIRFGDLNDRSSRVALAKNDPRSYVFLEELQLRPRTTYLAKLRNPVSEPPPGAGRKES